MLTNRKTSQAYIHNCNVLMDTLKRGKKRDELKCELYAGTADLSSDCPTRQSVTTCAYSSSQLRMPTCQSVTTYVCCLYTEQSRARAIESLGVRKPLPVGREGVESSELWWVGLLHLVNYPTSRTSFLEEGEHLLDSKWAHKCPVKQDFPKQWFRTSK